MLSTNLGVAVVLGDMSETPVDQIFKKVCVCVWRGGGGEKNIYSRKGNKLGKKLIHTE